MDTFLEVFLYNVSSQNTVNFYSLLVVYCQIRSRLKMMPSCDGQSWWCVVVCGVLVFDFDSSRRLIRLRPRWCELDWVCEGASTSRRLDVASEGVVG